MVEKTKAHELAENQREINSFKQYKNFNYKNDFLIGKSKFNKSYFTARDLLANKDFNALFIDKDRLNIFQALIKYKDFKTKLPLHHTPYANFFPKFINNIIDALPSYYTSKKHLNIRRIFSYYMRYGSTLQWKAYKNWFNNGYFPLLYLRVLAKIYSNEFCLSENGILSYIIRNIQNITDSRRQSVFMPPLDINSLLKKEIFYLVGVSLGDGTNIASGERWDITDGHTNKKYLIFSYQHLHNAKLLLEKKFGIKIELRKMPGNKYSLRCSNKAFCRYLNFFLDVPFGKKEDAILSIPSIIQLVVDNEKEEFERYFWIGLFDSDGSIIKNSVNVQISTTSKPLMYSLYDFLIDHKLNPSIKEYNGIKRINPLYNVFIPTSDFKKFALTLGFLHPLKNNLLMNALRKGPTQKGFKHLKNIYSIGDYLPFEKFKILRIKGANNIFKNYRCNLSLSQNQLAIKLGVTSSAISLWERGVNCISYSILLTMAHMNSKSKEDLIKSLMVDNSRFLYVSCNSNKIIKFPFKITQELLHFAEFVRPNSSTLYIKRRGNFIKSDLSKFFGVDIETTKKEDVISSLLLVDLFSELFIYEIPWKSLNEKELVPLLNFRSLNGERRK